MGRSRVIKVVDMTQFATDEVKARIAELEARVVQLEAENEGLRRNAAELGYALAGNYPLIAR